MINESPLNLHVNVCGAKEERERKKKKGKKEKKFFFIHHNAMLFTRGLNLR